MTKEKFDLSNNSRSILEFSVHLYLSEHQDMIHLYLILHELKKLK